MSRPSLIPNAKLPDWVFIVAKDGGINSKDLCAIYGVSKSTFSRWVREGRYPKPDFVSHSAFKSVSIIPSNEWLPKTVINFAKEHNGN